MLAALLGLLTLAPWSAAQPTVPQVNPLLGAELLARRSRALETDPPPLEGALDPQAYIVGPGDVFAFVIGGRAPTEQRATVSADGLLIVPEVGGFRVAGRPLAAVRSELRSALRGRYANVDTDVALAEPRRFFVHVSGEVAEPGRHVAIPIARVEDALYEAMGEASPLQVFRDRRGERSGRIPALRNVEVRHRDGTTEGVDLLRYYATGDVRYNPYLLDGDVLYVPAFQLDGQAVFVEDRFAEVQAFDFRPGDTAADVLALARGPEALTQLEAVRHVRLLPEGTLDVTVLSAADLAAGRAASLSLQPQDRLLLVDPNREHGRIEVEGAVVYPGTYALVEGQTRLRDVLALAGGLRPDALPRGAYLERPLRRAEEGDAAPARQENLPLEARAALVEQEAYAAGRLSDLSFGSRQFLAREVLSFQRVSLNLEEVLSGDAPPVPLRDGDRLVVPFDPGGVFVIGQVRQPGLVPYRAGATAEDYVAAAGGLGPAATGVYVRETGTGLLRPADGVTVQPGDYVFVDRVPTADSESLQALAIQERQLALQERRERADARARLITTTLGIVGTVLSAVSVYLLAQSVQDSGN
ncbi:MAG TPA: SLBB domain-containing protein [Rubricoccaceae bacterium]|nr:SLBB domain-containing protein [Rubricoccaceae bacterium]